MWTINRMMECIQYRNVGGISIDCRTGIPCYGLVSIFVYFECNSFHLFTFFTVYESSQVKSKFVQSNNSTK